MEVNLTERGKGHGPDLNTGCCRGVDQRVALPRLSVGRETWRRSRPPLECCRRARPPVSDWLLLQCFSHSVCVALMWSEGGEILITLPFLCVVPCPAACLLPRSFQLHASERNEKEPKKKRSLSKVFLDLNYSSWMFVVRGGNLGVRPAWGCCSSVILRFWDSWVCSTILLKSVYCQLFTW